MKEFGLRERSVIHFNVADFAVSVERVVNSGLRGRPLIIAPLQAARAEVYDMSEEAFREGVRKGMPLRQATRICRGATLLVPRPVLYQKAMDAFFKEVRNYSPLIDSGFADGHFFIDVTGTHRLYGPPPDIALRIRRYARSRLGINPIWTLGTSKLVSKVASRLVKPVGEYIVSPGDESAFLAALPVAILPGLTRSELRKMNEFQLNTVGALAGLSRSQLMVPFGSRSAYLHNISRGVDDIPVGNYSPVVKSVDYEQVFADDTNDRRAVETVLADMISRAGYCLRSGKQVARRVGVWLRYSDGTHVVRQASRRVGSNSDFVLRSLAFSALQRAWIKRTRLRGCRLVCDRLHRQSPQLLLFPDEGVREIRQEKILTAMDAVYNRFGHQLIRTGCGCSMKSDMNGVTAYPAR